MTVKVLAALPSSGVIEIETTFEPTSSGISALSTPDAVIVLLTLITAKELCADTRTLIVDTALATVCVYVNSELLND